MAAAATEDDQQGTQKKVLSVGLVCLDIVKVVTHFPVEDTDQRCEDCIWRRGGNASNTSTVLSLLGARAEYLGTLANGPYLQFLQSDFEENGILFDHCPVLNDAACPVSLIILNKASGSRTILHTNKNLQEFSFDDFQKLPLASGQFSWIHFEGRPNFEEMRKMLLHIEEHNSSCEESSKVITSLEIEKVQRVTQLRDLMQHVDYVFVSKEAATSQGFTDQQTAVEGLVSNCRDGTAVICPWGEKGASAKRKGTPAVTSPAFPPEVIVDTIGAGDTFNAATIFALNSGKSLAESVTFGCKVAGAKCGMMGNAGLRGMTF